jgi:enamine deaminase RidA (YjgF/YER057c/UK114 family)
MEPTRSPIFGSKYWSPKYTYVPALRVGDLVFLSGTTDTDDNNQIVGLGDIVVQTEQIFRKFEQLLASVGGSCRDIVQTVDYITTMENYAGTAEVRRRIFGDQLPTSTGVIVAGLLREGALIEISAIAIVPEGGR